MQFSHACRAAISFAAARAAGHHGAMDTPTTPDPIADTIATIATLAQLEARLAPLAPASVHKEIDHVHPLYRRWIEAAPFAVLATSGPGGLDASPRGDPPGFAVVQDARTLLLPERRGNQRADSLRNIVADPRVALLFLVPGLGETLRVNGSARIRVAPELLARFAVQGKPPFCVLEIAVQSVYFQCARAIQRAGLWQAAPARAQLDLPTPGDILSALTQGSFDGAGYDRELPARQRATLY